ncbi:small multi-drug export protein [Caldalkalibacillus salinus]|uniref:small multi-drug export protein n=1 Tax=Caldalkalibacillus salinus TaxID=2803787 RepID=UPI00301A0AC4
MEVAVVIPIAIIAGLAPIPVLLLALLGNLATVILMIVFIDKIKRWRQNRKQAKVRNEEIDTLNATTIVETEKNNEDTVVKESKRERRARKIWGKYGLPGLAIIGPFFVGSHLTALMSMVLGGTKKHTAAWMLASITLWSVAFASLTYVGAEQLRVGIEEGTLYRFFQR